MSAVQATNQIQTTLGAPPQSSVTRTEFDGVGRLKRVIEPGNIPTRYDYDMAGRLVKVSGNEAGGACGQTRLFQYDNRGFLVSEQTPELGAAGNGSAVYQYDARGNLIRKTVGPAGGAFDVRSEYDRAGRLSRVYEAGTTGGVNRTLKLLRYGTANAVGSYGNGQMTLAARFNWIPDLGINVQILEEYDYSGREGAISARLTSDRECMAPLTTLQCNELFAGTAKRMFRQTFAYDELGATTTALHPECLLGDCAAAALPVFEVTNTYDRGWLTGVQFTGAPNTASIAYHDNGMTASVTHANGVLDQILLDPFRRIPRPHEMTTTNFVDAAACVAPTFAVQPQSSSVSAGSSAVLTARADGESGTSPSYVWYRGTYPDRSAPQGAGILVNGETRLTTGSLNATTSYWVEASNACPAGGSLTGASQTATITVCAPPAITAQPQSQSITRTQSVTLSVTATGTGPLRYQWSTVSGGSSTAITGAVSATLTVAPTVLTQYKVAVTNDCGTVTSNTATITVYAPPTVPTQVNAMSDGSANTVQWLASTSVPGISYYEVARRNSTVFRVNMPAPLQKIDVVAPGSATLYRVRAVDANGVAGPWSAYDLTTSIAFADDPLVQFSTPVRGAHIGQLRQAIDAVRSAAGLSPGWAGNYGAATGLVLATHVTQMRAMLDEARVVLGLPALA